MASDRPSTTRPPRVAIVASRSQREGEAAPLARFLRDFAPFLTKVLKAELLLPGATHDAALESGALAGYRRLTRLPPVREGGLVTLTALVVGLPESAAGIGGEIDWVIYLLDPNDIASLYPETQALKRQCVVNDKPFLSTEAAASEWCALEWHRAVRLGEAPAHPGLDAMIARWVRPDRIGEETLSLIAHDTLKLRMLDFATRHRPLLERFGRRVATGTTGTLLNGELPARLAGADPDYLARLKAELAAKPGAPWVEALKSGPRGGDAQIAQAVMLGECRRSVFFEDPHVAREHEADIQLLERATRFAPAGCLCLNSHGPAERWAENLEALLDERDPGGIAQDGRTPDRKTSQARSA